MTSWGQPAERALLLTRNLPPLRGGMERLNLRLALALQSRYEVAVSGPAGCSRHLRLPPGSVVECRHGPLAAFMAGCALGALRLARRRRPALVIAGSGLTAPLAWAVARLTGARSVVYLHGLDVIVENPFYQRLWVPLIRRMELVLANSRNTARLAERAGVPAGRIRVLHPGTDLPGPDEEAARAFRSREDLGDRPLLLSVGRLTRRKGLAELVTHALPPILERVPRALLLVIGEDAKNALTGGGATELERIKHAAAAAGVEHAVRFLPHCDDATLSAAYRAADAYVFPVLHVPGDVEGFGMVAVEAAAHGLPTIAFDVGGVADAVVEGRTGHLVPPGDYQALVRAIVQRLDARHDAGARAACAEAARDFGWDRFEARLLTLLCGAPAERPVPAQNIESESP